ncbi:MAG TPA: hypothetical protein DCS93_01680 [Microscillaceae bacterium]|nr:hypothetical protein [Microscillaceae bacterium]
MTSARKVDQQMANLWQKYEMAKPNDKFWKAYEKAVQKARKHRQVPTRPIYTTSEEAYAHLPRKEFYLALKIDGIDLKMGGNLIELLLSPIELALSIIIYILAVLYNLTTFFYQRFFKIIGAKIPMERATVKIEPDHIFFTESSQKRKVQFQYITGVIKNRNSLTIQANFPNSSERIYPMLLLDEWGKPIPEAQTIYDLLQLVVKENKAKLPQAVKTP